MTLTPYLCVDGAREALDWYSNAFGARVTFEPIVMDDGRIGHVELTIGEHGRFMMSDPFGEAGVAGPDATRGAAVSLHLHTADVDDLTARAAAAGARIDRGPQNTPHGRLAILRDPFGHRWMLNTEA